MLLAKWPKKGSVKPCENCGQQFVVKYVRFARTCGRACAARLRIKEGTNGRSVMPSTWQQRLERCVAKQNAKWRNHLVQCEQCGRHRSTKAGRCKQCIEKLSPASLGRLRAAVQQWLKRHQKKCKGCSNTVSFQKHFCDSCLRQKKRDTHDCNHRQRCRRYGSEYHTGVTIKAVVARDGKKCYYCNTETRRWNGRCDPDITTLDHVIPISMGGGHTITNVVIACAECNSRKSNRIITLF